MDWRLKPAALMTDEELMAIARGERPLTSAKRRASNSIKTVAATVSSSPRLMQLSSVEVTTGPGATARAAARAAQWGREGPQRGPHPQPGPKN
jgi:hypothetical protein